MIALTVDSDTKNAIRNSIDEYAVEKHRCRYFPEWADHFSQVCANYFTLWEGHQAGQPMKLLDWQKEVTDAVFGWAMWSDEYDQWIRRFQIATVFVPKKSGKSPLAAAVGNYLLCFDREPGQQVWSAAKDGPQAAIVHRHAQNMAMESAQLRAMGVKVNQSTGVIKYPALKSFYRTMSCDNIQGQEGRNGSCVLDEIHVVPDKLVQVLEGMGASRRNPLRFEISTAGDNKYGYGGKQYEYGKQVNEGFIKDVSFYFRAWEVPDQNVSDEELVTNEKLWEISNPSLGVTVSRSQFKSTMMRARRSVTDWANFKQRRFGIWQKSANPFLKGLDWTACAVPDMDFEDFRNLGGGLGLDMARNHDFAAAVFVVNWNDDGHLLRLYPVIWATEDGLQTVAARVTKIWDWHAKGHVIQVEGATITNADIISTLAPMIRHARTRVLAYDPSFTTDIVQGLQKANRKMISAEFQQTFAAYASPTAEFEASVIDHTIGHPDNEVLNWMAGHCMCKEIAGKKKPLKDTEAPWQKIDGIQAAVMGVHAESLAPRKTGRKIKVVAV